jgi:hypothetical protein
MSQYGQGQGYGQYGQTQQQQVSSKAARSGAEPFILVFCLKSFSHKLVM